jgi:hypothetical protein
MPIDKETLDDDGLTVTQSALLDIIEDLSGETFNNKSDLGAIAVRAQVGAAVAASYQALETGRLVNAVTDAVRAIDGLAKLFKDGAVAGKNLDAALEGIRKAITSNG